MIETEQLALMEFQTPSMPFLDVERCYTKVINYETAARMVKTYHYAHRVPSVVVAIGMYVDDILAGCITFGSPTSRNATELAGKQYATNILELTRLFIFDWCGYNSESWLIGQSFQVLNASYPNYFILISYADAKEDHTGYIYQATNWLYTGRTPVERTGYVINGKFVHRRTVNMLYQSSAEAHILTLFPSAKPVFDIGKHRYVYFLGNRRQRRKLRKALRWSVLPYPKGENDATD